MDRFDMERRVAQKLTRLSRRWRILGDQALAELGLSNSTGWCLLYLSRLGTEARQSDLAQAVGVREATLGRTLVRLEALGLVARFPNPKDARANLMRLTDLGQSLVHKIEELLAQLRQDILKNIDEDDLAATLRACDNMDARFAERGI